MNTYLKRFLIIAGTGLMFVFIAQLIIRNFYLASSLEYSAACAISDSLGRTRQAMLSRIAVLESPVRLREIGDSLGLVPLDLSSFSLMEVDR